jgi:cysteine desulfuration protein SufE
MSKPITEIEAEIIEEFEMFDDWMDRYKYIIEMGQSLPTLDEQFKTDDHIVRGCQSQVWLEAHNEGEQVCFGADSDAIITKGLIALLTRVLSGHSPDDILNARLDFVNKIGLHEHLSPTRSNGLNAMIKKMKMYALAYKAKAEGQASS